jgi:AraC family transcriptional regulator
LYDASGGRVLAKIAVELERALARRSSEGTSGRTDSRIVARGDGWTVADVICTSGPEDRPFEEQHTHYAIAMVVAGTFQYRSPLGRCVMTPGGVMLGNPGQCYECGHEHARGDRCVAFWYAPDYFERLAADVRGRGERVGFRHARIPALRPLAPVVARAAGGAMGTLDVAWEELGVALAARVAGVDAGAASRDTRLPPNAVAHVTRAVRRISRYPDAHWTLTRLARDARLSPYHFLRTFQRVSGVTPHQFILRARLREATARLASKSDSVLEIALDCGFGDVSNFNRAFRTEFGVSPTAYRQSGRADLHSRKSCRPSGLRH